MDRRRCQVPEPHAGRTADQCNFDCSCSISIWWCEQLAVIRRSLWPFNQSCIFVSSCCQLASFHLLTYKLYSIVYMHSGWLIWSGKKQINTCINMGCIPKKRKRNSQDINIKYFTRLYWQRMEPPMHVLMNAGWWRRAQFVKRDGNCQEIQPQEHKPVINLKSTACTATW